jgi:hypothetical protein
MNIRERVLARRDLDAARAARNLDALAAGLNQECVPVDVPEYVRAADELAYVPHGDVFLQILLDAAAGIDIVERAQAFTSDQGGVVMGQGLEPPMVDRLQVADAVYYPDGRERE